MRSGEGNNDDLGWRRGRLYCGHESLRVWCISLLQKINLVGQISLLICFVSTLYRFAPYTLVKTDLNFSETEPKTFSFGLVLVDYSVLSDLCSPLSKLA